MTALHQVSTVLTSRIKPKAKNNIYSHNIAQQYSVSNCYRTKNRTSMNSSSRRQFLRPVVVLCLVFSLAAVTTAFRVLESPSTSSSANNYPNNQKNQQSFTSLLPPLPVATSTVSPWGTPTTRPTNGGLLDTKQQKCSIAGVNMSKADVRKNHLSHHLWYDDHNPTARKVKYCDTFENGYVFSTYYGRTNSP
jgi:hypothetical protein